MKRLLALALLLGIAVPAAAQVGDTTKIPTGVRLGLIYQPGYAARIAVRPLETVPAGDQGLGAVAAEVQSILRRDLDYSDRFEMYEVPPSLATGPVDYPKFNDLGLVYLVTGAIGRGAAGGYELRVTLHDVVYKTIKDNRVFRLPGLEDPDFRMSVHVAADALVQWATGQPGMAATRVAYIRKAAGRYELMVADYDGENVKRLAGTEQILLSPSWSPDGSRMAYSLVNDEGHYQIQERDVGSGQVRVVVDRGGLAITPTYTPDGNTIAFAITNETGGTDIYRYDARRRCCLEKVAGGRGRELSPVYSADGSRMAFNSDRLGQPQIYVMSASGGEADLLSPFVYGEPGYYTSPDWSPTGSLVAFHGRSRGNFQIMVADADRPGAVVQQVTADGVSEDPSWAPDGRHLVFSGIRAGGRGLYIVDSVTGRIRPLVLGGEYLVPDWSPTLIRASETILEGRQEAASTSP